MKQQQCRFSRLDPPIVVMGLAVGAVLRFRPTLPGRNEADENDGRTLIGEWTAHNVIEIGAGVWDIIVARGVQTSDVDMGDPGQRWNYEWQWKGGANAAQSDEALRGVSHANARFLRGPDAADRLHGGDGICRYSDAEGPLMKLLGSYAMDTAPAAVDWKPGEEGPRNFYRTLAIPDGLSIAEQAAEGGEGRAYVDLTGSALYAGEGISWRNSGTLATGACARKVFNVSDGEGIEVADPFFLPADALFSATEAEYWIDPISYEVRVSPSAVLFGDEIFFTYWLEAAEGEAEAFFPTVIRGKSVELVRGDFGRTIAVVSTAGNASAGWQRSTLEGSDAIWVEWSEDRELLAVRYREDGITTDIVFSDQIAGDPFQVAIVKTGSTISITFDGTAVGSHAFAELNEEDEGFPFVECGEGIRIWEDTTRTRVIIGNGVQHLGRSLEATGFLGYQIGARPSGDEITEVFNETAGAAMAVGATASRCSYQDLGEAGLLFYSTSNGDRIRITTAAPAPSPGTGRPPRTFNQLHGATTDPEDEWQSTTDVNENRLNWHDRLRVRWEGEGPPMEVGDVFRGYRYGVFDPDDPPALEYSDDGGETWQALGTENYRAYWWEGAVFLASTWLAGRTSVWIRATGKRVRVGAEAEPETAFNELARALDCLDQAWANIRTDGPGGTIGGYAAQFIGYWSPSCYGPDGGARFNQFGWGYAASTTAQPPYWYVDAFNNIAWFDTTSRTYHAPGTGPSLTCYDSFANPVNHSFDNEFIPGDVATWAMPFGLTAVPPGSPAPAAVYFGSTFHTGSEDYELVWVEGAFNFPALGITPQGLARQLPEGAEILEAWLAVKAMGLKKYTWSFTSNLGDTNFASKVENGVETLRLEGGVVTFQAAPADADGGSLSFGLFGVRYDRRTIYDYAGNAIEVPSNTYVSLGGVGSPTAIASGEWGLVEVTAALQAMIANRDSEYGEFQLWPSAGGSLVGADAPAMGAYAESLLGPRSSSFTTDAFGNINQSNRAASGVMTYCDEIAYGNLLVRFRLGSTVKTWPVLPLRWPRFVTASP